MSVHDTPTEALVHLLAVLRGAVALLDRCGFDVDARYIEAHAAQLARGREWYGDPIQPVRLPDEQDVKSPLREVS